MTKTNKPAKTQAATDAAVDQLRDAMVAPAQTAIRMLAERLTGGYSPWQEMRDTDAVFEAAAIIDTWARVTFLRGRHLSLETIAGILRDDVCNDSRHPSRSTSACTNLSMQCRTMAQADIADKLLGIAAGRTR